MAETLAKTGLGSLAPGDRVNLERAVTAGTRLGGHLVQGHVDAVGHVVRRDPGEHWDVVTVSMPRRPRAVPRRQGLDHRRRREPDRRRGRGRRVHGEPDPRDPPAHDAGVPAARRRGQPRGRRDRQVRRPPARAAARCRHELPPVAVQLPAPRHGPPSGLPGARSSATHSVSPPRSGACGAGCGPGRSASSATCCCSASSSPRPSSRTRSSRCSARPVVRCSSSITSVYGWWRWRQVKAGRAADAPAITPRWATRGRAARLPPGLAGGPAGLPVGVRRDRRRLPGSALVLLVRRLDLRRLHGRDVRHGSRLERLLAGLDRRRPGRRTPAVAQPLLPDVGPVRRLRRLWSRGDSSSGCAPAGEEAPTLSVESVEPIGGTR